MTNVTYNLAELADSILEAGEAFAEYLDGDDAHAHDNGFGVERPYKQAVIDAVREIAEAHGCEVDCDYDNDSTYIDVRCEDTGEFFQVRASNHRQAWGGPVWSFEPHADRAKVVMGLETVAREAKDAAEVA